jgi:hypothetical protein
MMCDEDLLEINSPELVTVSGAPYGSAMMKMPTEEFEESHLIYR